MQRSETVLLHQFAYGLKMMVSMGLVVGLGVAGWRIAGSELDLAGAALLGVLGGVYVTLVSAIWR